MAPSTVVLTQRIPPCSIGGGEERGEKEEGERERRRDREGEKEEGGGEEREEGC